MVQCGEFCYVLWATVQIWLCAMGHWGEFGYTLWATAQNEAILYCKNYNNFCTIGHGAGFGYALWAIAKDLVICNGPWKRILLGTLGHSA
jgi:hypothetical protein